jgi:hypothetical protein
VSWQWWVVLAGVILAVVGAVLALIGFSRTWKDFRSDRKFSGVLISWVIVAGRQVAAAAIKLRNLVHLRGRNDGRWCYGQGERGGERGVEDSACRVSRLTSCASSGNASGRFSWK